MPTASARTRRTSAGAQQRHLQRRCDAVSWTWSDGGAYQRTFDAYGRLVSYPLGNPGRARGWADAHVTYDKSRGVLGYTQARRRGATAVRSDIPLRRAGPLGRRPVAGTQYGYTYDLNGNRTTRVINATATSTAWPRPATGCCRCKSRGRRDGDEHLPVRRGGQSDQRRGGDVRVQRPRADERATVGGGTVATVQRAGAAGEQERPAHGAYGRRLLRAR